MTSQIFSALAAGFAALGLFQLRDLARRIERLENIVMEKKLC